MAGTKRGDEAGSRVEDAAAVNGRESSDVSADSGLTSTAAAGDAFTCVDVAQLLSLLWALGPLLIFWVAPLNVYDGVRHFLFIFPALALLGAAPLRSVQSTAPPTWAFNASIDYVY